MNVMNNINLARKIEDIKRHGTKEYMINRKHISPPYEGDYLSLAGKGDLFCMGDYSFAVGFGMNGEMHPHDIDSLEDFVRKQDKVSSFHMELTPFSDPSFMKQLQEREYILDHFLSVWILPLENWSADVRSTNPESVSVVKITEDQSAEWARTVSLGFSNDHTVTEEAIESAKCFVTLSNSNGFLLKEGGKSVAAGNIAITDELGEMYLTSTLHSHRGKGYQRLLIEERLAYAKSRGCTHVTVTTKPNTISAENMEKCGFTLMYNKAVLKSPPLK